jgi:hypothetical protein
MPNIITIEGGEPDEMPEWQSPASVERIIAGSKAGDIVHIVPKDRKLEYLLKNLGIDQIHGCVDDESTRETLILWSTYYAANADAFRSKKHRSYAQPDIRLIMLDKAEEYIPQSTEGKFQYKMEAQVRTNGGLFIVTVDSLFNGIMSGKTADDKRITGGINFFTPYKG